MGSKLAGHHFLIVSSFHVLCTHHGGYFGSVDCCLLWGNQAFLTYCIVCSFEIILCWHILVCQVCKMYFLKMVILVCPVLHILLCVPRDFSLLRGWVFYIYHLVQLGWAVIVKAVYTICWPDPSHCAVRNLVLSEGYEEGPRPLEIHPVWVFQP